jgi:hypothetical protein
VPRAELGRHIRVLDPNLAQSLRTFIISKPKFEHVASTGELHISVGIQAKACNEGASAEVRFCPIHGRSPCPVSRSATETLTPLPDLLTATAAPPLGRGRELEDPSPTNRPQAALLQFPINQPLIAGGS